MTRYFTLRPARSGRPAFIIAEVVGYPEPLDVNYNGTETLTRRELEATEEGRRALVAWTAGDDSAWGQECAEFDAMVEDLVSTLDEFKVAKEDQRQLLRFFESLRGEVIEVESAETGTALPDTFQAMS